MRVIRVAKKFPDGTDTFFAPKIKGCFDDRYLIPGFKTKICEFVAYDPKGNDPMVTLMDEVSLWLGNEFYIATTNIRKIKGVEIYFAHGKRLRIKVDGEIWAEPQYMVLSQQFGCYAYGDFVDYCFDLCMSGTEVFKGKLIYWK